MKKILSIILTVIMLVSMIPLGIVPATAAATLTEAYIEQNTNINISSLEDMNVFAEWVNKGNSGEGKTFTLTADIGTFQTTIASDSCPFEGIFDGAGYTVNVYRYFDFVNGYQNPALFASLGESAIVKNLTVSGSIITKGTDTSLDGDNQYISGLCGNNSGIIINCLVKANISSARHEAAGLCINNTAKGRIINCLVSGTVSSAASYAICASNYFPSNVVNCYYDNSLLYSYTTDLPSEYSEYSESQREIDHKFIIDSIDVPGAVINCLNSYVKEHRDDCGGLLAWTKEPGEAPYPSKNVTKPVSVEILNKKDTIQVGIKNYNDSLNGLVFEVDGTTEAVESGEYSATFTLINGYTWKDGSTAPLEVKWTIDSTTHIGSIEEFNKYVTILNDNADYDGGLGVTFVLDSDIVYSGDAKNPTINNFKGTLDGAGHKITLNGNPLFGTICENATVKNVVTDGTVSGNCDFAGLCNNNSGNILHCINQAQITATYNGYADVAGICYKNETTGRIVNCINSGTVTADGSWGAVSTGGICGTSEGMIINCLNTGIINSLRGSTKKIAGICGNNYPKTVTEVYYDDWDEFHEWPQERYYNVKTIVNCVDAGVVAGNTEGETFGAISAYHYGNAGNILNCYYDSNMKLATRSNYGLAGCTECYSVNTDLMKAESNVDGALIDMLNKFVDENTEAYPDILHWAKKTGELPYPAQPVVKPVAIEDLTETGEEQVGVNYNKSQLGGAFTIGENDKVAASEGGNYSATFTLADGYVWTDNTTAPVTVNWSIKSSHTVHDYTNSYVDNGDGTHSGVCECGEVDTVKTTHTIDPTTGKCVCGAVVNIVYKSITFKPWIKTDSLPTDADNYYLVNDVTLTGEWIVNNDTKLLLNGKVIKQTGNASVLTVNGGKTLEIYDNDTTTPHYFSVGNDGLWKLEDEAVEGCKTLYGGIITGGVAETGGGIYVLWEATLKLNGGSVVGNKASKAEYKGNGGGVSLAGSANFEMNNNAAIIGNIADCFGGGVYNGGNFTFNDGIISSNKALGNSNSQGGGVYSNSYMIMNGGSISENESLSGGGIKLAGNTVVLNGGIIEKNLKDGVDIWAGNLYLGGSIVINGNISGSYNKNLSVNQGQYTTTDKIKVAIGDGDICKKPENGMLVRIFSSYLKIEGAVAGDEVFFNTDDGSKIISFDEDNDGPSVVTVIAKIGDAKYASLEKAINAVENNGTIKLAANVLNETITVSKVITFTIDNNGKTNGATISAGKGYDLNTEGNKYIFTEHVHDYTNSYKDNGDGTHSGVCECGEIDTVKVSHTYDGTGSCVCGAKAPLAAPTAKTGLTYDGTTKTGVAEGEGYTLENNTATDAGTYTAIAKLKDGYVWADADFDGKIEWTIAKADAKVTANNTEKVCGEADPEFTATETGTYGDDKLEYTFERAEGTDAGTYVITPKGEAVQGNYNVTYEPGTLTIKSKDAALFELIKQQFSEKKVEKGGLMGRQGLVENKIVSQTKGRTIIGLTETQLENIGDTVVVMGVDGTEKEVKVTLDCAYTYFYDGTKKITAESLDVAAFLIIDDNGSGETIDGYGYYRLYNGEVNKNNFLFDVLNVPTNKED